MYKLLQYSPLAFLFFIFACNSADTDTNGTVKSDTLAYTIETYKLESKIASKKPDSLQDTTYFEASYPYFEDSTLNSYVQSLLVFNNDPGTNYKTLQEAGQAFINSYEDFRKEEYSSPWAWYSAIKATVPENHPLYLGVEVYYEDFMGGAHGNYGTKFSNFDLTSKKALTIQDIIQSDKMDSLTSVAEEIFKKDEGINSLQNSFENYFFEEGKFSLNNNFLLKENSIVFLYNIYEIKAYVEGVTKLEIPYSKINNFLTPQAKAILGIN